MDLLTDEKGAMMVAMLKIKALLLGLAVGSVAVAALGGTGVIVT